MPLSHAILYYGSSAHHVEPDAHLPLPVSFDFDEPEACARKIFAVMSHASGGHPLRDCKLKIHRGRQSANLTADGCHVYYADPSAPKLSFEQAIAMEGEVEHFALGTVVTDQYGEGWKRASWN